MSLRDYQQQVDATLQPLEKPYWEPLSQLARLIEEVGEVARILNHRYGDKPKKPDEILEDLAGELGDIIFVVLAMANNEGIDLDPALERAMAKLDTRDKHRFPKKPK